MKGREIRKAFLDYFARNGHEIVPSSSLVPADDPTLLFTNAGMVQFKRVFLGEEERPYRRAASCQKCMRAGGKHNDLENVGYTARHHTFFEMLGNFSFGDYFKAEAIAYAWEFLTRELGLPPERLYATVFREDDEAADLWRRISGLPEDRIVRLGEKDNFWAMGDSGPCGPCSEIIYDQGEEVGCGRSDCGPGCDCDRFLEIWNLVFMQYERDEFSKLKPLPRPSIDTGMGLERITAVIQGVQSNYDTDIFAGIMKGIADLSGRSYEEGGEITVAFRVIADHLRASVFLIADGVVPSNEGRGYVLRRIIRRAERFGRLLGLTEPFLFRLVPRVVSEFGDFYPELRRAERAAEKILEIEEGRFQETLAKGLELLETELERLSKAGEYRVPGGIIFRLYDTYGFPQDIVRDVAFSRGFELDLEGFEKAMAEARERSRRSWKGRLAMVPEVLKRLSESFRETPFVGYESFSTEAEVLALIKDEKEVPEAAPGEELLVLFSETPFYPEGGGQVADIGLVLAPGLKADVLEVRRFGGLVLHRVRVVQGILHRGQRVRLEVIVDRRLSTARHHTATHLLHAALRRVLGEHVRQAGSLVTPDRLRFDFTHFEPLTHEEIRSVESLVNRKIREDISISVQVVPFREALSMGALALFGEKYGDRVRVVRIGDFSLELCGGTHVRRTGELGLFKIVSEGGVAAGVRRIEAVAGEPALRWIYSLEDEHLRLAQLLRCSPQEVEREVRRLLERVKELEAEVRRFKSGAIRRSLEEKLTELREVDGVKVLCTEVPARNAAELREMGDFFRDRLGSGVVFLYAVNDGKVQLLAMVTRDLSGRIPAEKLLQAVAPVVEGRGGGRPEMAQGGGSRPEAVSELPLAVLKKVKEFLGRTS
ncbi:alanine--tRNA ligase [Thermosulfurimonas sp. F29]|uniref:alanine--tRNA ligase n=1 Tax=Thermosulfurimonas sp. F29 TaxID=2867247 RepID=UPI001C838F77|nr:alanine--tRNA ligase [Thermosulfurimonas sp. F29]MBX6423745.1 alanine--tRNA ligase [Thermosulfurimonas sp. F29]